MHNTPRSEIDTFHDVCVFLSEISKKIKKIGKIQKKQ